MGQIIRLTESDLTRLVKRIINESPFDSHIKKGEGYYDKADYGFEGPHSRKDKSEIIKVIRTTKSQLEDAKNEVNRLERQLAGYEKMRKTWIKSKDE
jgi:hypothetical protein